MPLPAEYRDKLKISWHLSSWCNYSCPYCPVLVFGKKSGNPEHRQKHAFDYYPVERWVDALTAIPYGDIALNVTGGEPMLDRKNVLALFDRLTLTGRYRISVDTNGSWDPGFFSSLAGRDLCFNIAFHPLDVDFETFFRRISKIRDAGFRIAMVNLVLDPKDLPVIEASVARLEDAGFFVNLSPMQPSGVYTGRVERTEREIELIEAYNTPLDLHFKVLKPPTQGRLCYYPAFTYYLQYDGYIRVFCDPGPGRNLFSDGLPPLTRAAVPCPFERCGGCNDQYRALVDEPRQTGKTKFVTLQDYADELKAHRESRRRKKLLDRIPLLGRAFGDTGQPSLRAMFDQAAREAEAASLQQVAPLLVGLGEPLPAEPVFGAVDGGSEAVIEAFPRERIALSGWAARRDLRPVQELRLSLDSHDLGRVEYFEYRPEIAARFGRTELAKSGWRTMVYLPALAPGDYQLRVQALAGEAAATADLPAPRIRIIA